MDNRVSKHLWNKEWFNTLDGVPLESKDVVGDNWTCPVKDIGSIPFVTSGGDEKVISNVLYVLDLCKNLLSGTQMVKHKMCSC